MVDTNHTTFGQMLLQMRESAGVSRAELAKRVKLDISHIFRLEKGGRRPSRKTVLLVGEALEVDSGALNQLLVAADYAPMALVGTSGTRARGVGRAIIRQTTLADRDAWLEQMGIHNANISRLLNAMERAGMSRRQELASAIRSALSITAEMTEAPLSTAVIPAVERNYNVFATHTVQRLLITVIREALDARISRMVLILAPGMMESIYLPIKEVLDIATTLPITLHCLEQAAGDGIKERILAAEKFIRDEPFAVLLPEYVSRAQRGQNAASSELARMVGAFKQMPGANLLAVARLPRYRMLHGGATVTDKLGDKPVLPVVNLFKRDELSDALHNHPGTLGIVGRYILQPTVFRELRDVQEIRMGPTHLIDGLEAMRQKGHNISAFKWEGLHQEAGAMLELANEFISIDSEG